MGCVEPRHPTTGLSGQGAWSSQHPPLQTQALTCGCHDNLAAKRDQPVSSRKHEDPFPRRAAAGDVRSARKRAQAAARGPRRPLAPALLTRLAVGQAQHPAQRGEGAPRLAQLLARHGERLHLAARRHEQRVGAPAAEPLGLQLAGHHLLRPEWVQVVQVHHPGDGLRVGPAAPARVGRPGRAPGHPAPAAEVGPLPRASARS